MSKSNEVVERKPATRPLPIVEPVVDIIRKKDGITLLADMPGVDEKLLGVEVKEDVLTLSGKSPISEKPEYNEFGAVEYHREFKLGNQIDRERIRASMRHGVLTVEMSLRAEAHPRKIEVQVHEGA